MVSNISIILGILSTILQFTVAYYSYKIYLFNRLGKGWISIIFAFILMGIRRITALLIEIEMLPTFKGVLKTIDAIWLPFIITLLITIGIYSMLKNFEGFEVVEKNLVNKLKKIK